jgi:hypothetical protein
LNFRSLVDGLSRLLGSGAAATEEADGTLSEAQAPAPAPGSAQRLLKEYLSQTAAAPGWGEIKPKEFEAGRAILAAEAAVQISIIRMALEWMAKDRGNSWDGRRMNRWQSRRGLLNQLLARHLPFTQQDLECLLTLVLSRAGNPGLPGRSLATYDVSMLPVRRILRQVELFAAEHGLPDELRSLLERLRPRGAAAALYTGDQDYVDRIDALLGNAPSEQERAAFAPDEPWA